MDSPNQIKSLENRRIRPCCARILDQNHNDNLRHSISNRTIVSRTKENCSLMSKPNNSKQHSHSHRILDKNLSLCCQADTSSICASQRQIDLLKNTNINSPNQRELSKKSIADSCYSKIFFDKNKHRSSELPEKTPSNSSQYKIGTSCGLDEVKVSSCSTSTNVSLPTKPTCEQNQITQQTSGNENSYFIDDTSYKPPTKIPEISSAPYWLVLMSINQCTHCSQNQSENTWSVLCPEIVDKADIWDTIAAKTTL